MRRQRDFPLSLAAALLAVVIAACTSAPAPSPASAKPDQPTGASTVTKPARPAGDVVPFTNIADGALGENALIENRYPGVALFDYDRDGDIDFYVTSAEVNAPLEETRGGPNKLFRNDGGGSFTEVAEEAGVAALESNSSGVVACDFNNDGYQDLYVGAYGRIGDGLDYRSVDASLDLREVVKDRLFLNKGDGTFQDITDSAFGAAANVRSAGSVACADVDGDGWLDLFVGNRADQDFVRFDNPRHHGHYNVLYRNNGDLTFADVTDEAGLRGPQIVMRDPFGDPIVWQDAETGVRTEGYDTRLRDAMGNLVGDPTAQTWAVLFFDHDDDGDPDLWLADDGDRLKVYRNDSTPGKIKFTSIGRAMGVDQAGAWMGFALGDHDGDADLDVFVTNIGFHPLTRDLPTTPGGDCAYGHQFDWGTCLHYLLQNDGTTEAPGVGTIGLFHDVAGATMVKPSQVMPPDSLDPSNIQPHWQVPTGLAAYDFGFGAAFFDYENDGDQDLYWLGSIIARGEGPKGMLFPGPGRMLRGDGRGAFEDITVESRLLDIQGVDYSILDRTDPRFNADRQRIHPRFHENGKGLAKGDLNGDGYVDLIGTNSNGATFAESGEIEIVSGPLFVWMNGGGENHWITLRLKGRRAVDGTGSNADAVGARVYLKAKLNGEEALTQVQDVLASSTFLSMNNLDLNFGLGDATKVGEIAIHWPSGVTQVLENIDADQVLEITEPKG